jgi:hypothetical protein
LALYKIILALKAIAEKMELAIEQALNAVVVGGQPCNRS